MIFEQQSRRAEGYSHRLVGGFGIRGNGGHHIGREDMAMSRNGRGFRGLAVIRITTRRHSRLGGYGGCGGFTETLGCVCKGVAKTNKKIRKSNEHQQRPANSRHFRLRRSATGPFHTMRLANFGSEHYYFVATGSGTRVSHVGIRIVLCASAHVQSMAPIVGCGLREQIPCFQRT